MPTPTCPGTGPWSSGGALCNVLVQICRAFVAPGTFERDFLNLFDRSQNLTSHPSLAPSLLPVSRPFIATSSAVSRCGLLLITHACNPRPLTVPLYSGVGPSFVIIIFFLGNYSQHIPGTVRRVFCRIFFLCKRFGFPCSLLVLC